MGPTPPCSLARSASNVKDARRASQFWSRALGYAYQDGAYSDDTASVLIPDDQAAPALALDEADRPASRPQPRQRTFQFTTGLDA
jgi:hypothetical protein